MKTILEKIKFNNLLINDLVGDDSVFIMKLDNYEIMFYDYDIDNDYDLRNRNIYKLDEFKIENGNVIVTLLIWMEDSKLLEKVTISSKKVFVKVYKKDKLFKEETIEGK
ncbi:MAG: hypothetical protein IKQ29_02480 [Bacilli bacterium]|nr:hypothetical protein [Bacilli bacterium]